MGESVKESLIMLIVDPWWAQSLMWWVKTLLGPIVPTTPSQASKRRAVSELWLSHVFCKQMKDIAMEREWKRHDAMGPLYKLRIASRCWCCWKGTASPTSSCRPPPDFSTHMQVLQIRSLWTVLMLSWRLVQSPKSSRSFLTLSLWLASATGSRGALRVVAHQVFGFLVLGLSFRAPHRRVWPASR